VAKDLQQKTQSLYKGFRISLSMTSTVRRLLEHPNARRELADYFDTAPFPSRSNTKWLVKHSKANNFTELNTFYAQIHKELTGREPEQKWTPQKYHALSNWATKAERIERFLYERESRLASQAYMRQKDLLEAQIETFELSYYH